MTQISNRKTAQKKQEAQDNDDDHFRAFSVIGNDAHFKYPKKKRLSS
jgi:hypothetical protein